jgi:hypothetical protein
MIINGLQLPEAKTYALLKNKSMEAPKNLPPNDVYNREEFSVDA